MFPKPVRSLMESRVWGYDPDNGKQTGQNTEHETDSVVAYL